MIVAHDGVTFIASLIRENLIDEYRLVNRLGRDRKRTSLFGVLRELLRLDLVKARTVPNGTVIHVSRSRERTRREPCTSAFVSPISTARSPSTPPWADGSDDFRTTWIVDPDGNRIELVQWPAGHAEGMSAADFIE